MRDWRTLFRDGAFLGLVYFDLYYHILMIIILTKVIMLKEANATPRVEVEVVNKLGGANGMRRRV